MKVKTADQSVFLLNTTSAKAAFLYLFPQVTQYVWEFVILD